MLRYKNRHDTLILPIVSAKYPALKKALTFKMMSGGEDDLLSVIKYYRTCGCGITGATYKVKFEGTNIISIEFNFETMGAYPDNYRTWRNIKVHTGTVYNIGNEINPAGLDWVYKTYKDTLRKRFTAERENKEEDAGTYTKLMQAAGRLKIYELLNDFVFTDDGIIFSTNSILPHAEKALEGDRDLLIPYGKLKRYKAKTGLMVK